MTPIEAARLRAGVDYPTDLSQFDRFFRDEEACAGYLQGLRWPEGFVCPKCGHAGEAWRMRRGLFLCSACRAQTSVTAGTIFEGTRKPLKLWFIAAWEITSHKYGANAANVQRVLGLKSYKTAWSWLHKLRRAMVCPDRDRLLGVVEVDEMYVGGQEEGVHGRETKKKAIVAVAVEVVDKKRLGRVRLRRVADVSGDALHPFVQQAVEPGSRVLTDGWAATPACLSWATIIGSSTSPPRRTPRTYSCRRCTASPPFSNAGSWARTRERSAGSTSTTTSTSIRSGSTGAAPVQGGCFSTACSSRPSKPSTHRPTHSSWARDVEHDSTAGEAGN